MPRYTSSRLGLKEAQRRLKRDSQIDQTTSEPGKTGGVSSRLTWRTRQTAKRRRSSLRAGLAIVGGRAAGAISRRLHLGGGTSIVGVVAQRIYPPIVEHLARQLEYGNLVVTGTNGKTTTSSFIAAILSDAGLRVWRNREGSNLMRGIASALVIRGLPNGRLRRSGRAIAVLEADEAALPQIVRFVAPRIAIFTNLFRDQLDRYGEVDSIAALWQKTVEALPPDTTLVLNADDPAVANLGKSFSGKVLYYGIDDTSFDLGHQSSANERHQVTDTRLCSQCGSDFTYSLRFYSHIGHYACPKCGKTRPQADVRAVQVQSDSFDRLRITVESTATTSSPQRREIIIPLPGLYNTYNALAAITATQVLGIDWEPITLGIEQSKPVFGRGERIRAEGRTIRLLLAKNPTGFNEVLRTLFNEGVPRHILFVLNNNIADGRDISWIWDVDFERCLGMTKTLVVAGTRSLDLALRLKYAGIAEEDMTIVPPAAPRSHSGEAQRVASRWGKRSQRTPLARRSEVQERSHFGLKAAMHIALDQVPEGETLFIVPTYTGLLEVHHELEERGLTARYWEGKDA